jgi:hypothetical protein
LVLAHHVEDEALLPSPVQSINLYTPADPGFSPTKCFAFLRLGFALGMYYEDRYRNYLFKREVDYLVQAVREMDVEVVSEEGGKREKVMVRGEKVGIIEEEVRMAE